MANPGRDQLTELVAKMISNAMRDHYSRQTTSLTREEYWKQRYELTGFQTIDDYIQRLVSAQIDKGLSTVSLVFDKVKALMDL